MLADDELREALATRLPDLEPDVEAELDRLLARADSLARRRRTAYVVGLVAAAVVAAGLVLGHDWQRKADEPEPVDDAPAQRPAAGAPSAGSTPTRRRWLPAATAPARSGRSYVPAVEIELDLPRDGARTTSTPSPPAPGTTPPRGGSTSFADVRGIEVNRCSDAHGASRPVPAPSAWPARWPPWAGRVVRRRRRVTPRRVSRATGVRLGRATAEVLLQPRAIVLREWLTSEGSSGSTSWPGWTNRSGSSTSRATPSSSTPATVRTPRRPRRRSSSRSSSPSRSSCR